MAFYRGQKVVCVGWESEGWRTELIHAWRRFWHPYADPVIGEIYTIAAIRTADDGDLMLVLAEHEGCDLSFWLPGFGADGFRPVVERSTDISVFTEILRKATRRQGADA